MNPSVSTSSPSDGSLTSGSISKEENENENFTSEVPLTFNSDASHLGNEIEISSSYSHIIRQELANWGVRGEVTHFEHGTYDSHPASLICFKIYFLFKGGGSFSRFSRAKAIITFTKFYEGERGGGFPEVKLINPKLLRGKVIPVKQEVKKGVSFDASIAPAMSSLVGLGGSLSFEKVDSFSKDFSMRIQGREWTSTYEGRDVTNIVKWDVEENKKQAEGIPTELCLGLIIARGEDPFLGTVEIQATTKSKMPLFAWPWSKPKPCVFRPGVTVGKEIGIKEFEKLTEEHWNKLTPLLRPVYVHD